MGRPAGFRCLGQLPGLCAGRRGERSTGVWPRWRCSRRRVVRSWEEGRCSAWRMPLVFVAGRADGYGAVVSGWALQLLDLVGIFVFGITGALVGVRKKLDVFGIQVLALVTGLGGGFIRDVLIGATPPAALVDWRYLVV